MGKLLLLILFITVFKCNGQLPGIGNFVPAAQRQVQGALGFASSLLGGVSSGFGLNFGGQLGYNSQKRPLQNGQQHMPQPSEEINQSNQNDYGQQNAYNYDNRHRPKPPLLCPDQRPPRPQLPSHHGSLGGYKPGYGNQGQYQGYPNQQGNQNHYNPSQSESNPVRPGSFNNGNYGNLYPNNQNSGNYPGQNYGGFNNNGKPNGQFQGNNDNQGYNNNNQFNQNGQGHPTNQGSGTYNKPGYGNNNSYNENNQEYQNNIDQVFGKPPQPNNGFNSATQTPNNGGLTSGNINHNNGGLTTGTLNSNNGVFNSGNQNPYNGEFTLENPSNKPSQFPSSPFSPTFNTGQKPKEELPTFVPLTPTDPKRETETKKPTGEDEDFEIDIRVKDE